MRFAPPLMAGLALSSAVSADFFTSPSYRKLLGSPPVSPASISMYPGRHPNHNGMDLAHLVPQMTRDLYFAQEGHRSEYYPSHDSVV